MRVPDDVVWSVDLRPARRGNLWRWVYSAALVVVFAAALGLRLWGLEERPFHADESVHAIKFGDLYQKGQYLYDANEYHGPTLYYATLPICWLSGSPKWVDINMATYRAAPAVAGALIVLLAGLAVGLRGWAVWLLSALLLALSPSLTYYSRYYIQEVILAAATVGYLGCLWRGAAAKDGRWLLGVGLFAGLMVATKETAAFAFAASVPALWLGLRGLQPAEKSTRAARHWSKGAVSGGLIVAVLVGGVLLSGPNMNVKAPLDFVASFVAWGHRAGKAELHRQVPTYYGRMLVAARSDKTNPPPPGSEELNHKPGPSSSEAFTLVLALLALLFGYRRDGLVRYLSVYSLLLWIIYTVMPYKTPWCIAQLVAPLALMGGIGGAELLRRLPRWWLKPLPFLILLAGCAHLGYEDYYFNHLRWVDGRNPYAYSPTAPDAADLAAAVEKAAKASPDGLQTVVKVVNTDDYYWPLPWYLRRLPNIGWYTADNIDVDAPIVIVERHLAAQLRPQLETTHTQGDSFGLRRGVTFVLWVRNDIWQQMLNSGGE